MYSNTIQIKGARENNLKEIHLDIPKYKLIALTGPSGSGKSSLAMSILQRECQRQYMESLGMVADGLNKPDVDKIIGLSPAIHISQRALGANAKSTVGTYTEILTYLRLLFAKVGERMCSGCGHLIQPFDNNVGENERDEQNIVCPQCKKKHKPLVMAHFSFNKPEGACEICNGFGQVTTIDLSQVVDENLTVKEGAFILWQGDVFGGHYADVLRNCGKHYGFVFDADKKVKDFNDLEKLVFYHGVDSDAFKALYPTIKKPKKVMDGYFKGIETFMKEKANLSQAKTIQNIKITKAFKKVCCPACNGSRLNEESRAVRVLSKTLPELMTNDIETLWQWVRGLEASLHDRLRPIVTPVIRDLMLRMDNMIKIGLGYLAISREVSTLSGGEAQRLKLAHIIDSSLTGVIYILDEPTTGLHPKDVTKLLDALKVLRDLGNTVITIEHDTDFIRQCNHVIDFGPGAGIHGGHIVAEGDVQQIIKSEHSVTGPYLSHQNIALNQKTFVEEKVLVIKNAYANNLKNIHVTIPLEAFVCFTGVSGSGKSSLVFECIARYIEEREALCDGIEGTEFIDRIVTIDQKAIGRQSRSNIATYTDVFTLIREHYANSEQAKKSKLKNSDFSFNVSGGRCENCLGLGTLAIDMQFMDAVEISCPICKGKRFKEHILSIKYQDKNISDILDMTVEEAYVFFDKEESIKHKLHFLMEVGLAYLTLGQPTSTLSGGECQRLKLSRELGKIGTGHTLYLLDEPTTGLHPSDISKILQLLNKLKEKGHSIFVIEHAMEVITFADYIIDLGSEGGTKGGMLMGAGTPYELSQNENSYTGKAIKTFIER